MSREILFSNYREEVIKKELPLLKKIEEFVINSGKITFDDVFEKPSSIERIFSEEGIIADLKVREMKFDMDERANGLMIFNQINSEIIGKGIESMYQLIITPDDKELAKRILGETLFDCETVNRYKSFFSEENKLQIVFSGACSDSNRFLLRMFRDGCGEDQ